MQGDNYNQQNIIQQTYPCSSFRFLSLTLSFHIPQKFNLKWNEREKSVRVFKCQECKICLHVNNTIL